MESHLANAAHERQETNEHRLVTVLPNVKDYSEPVIWGVFSHTLLSTKVRLLKSSAACFIGNGPQTPGDIARDYLDFYFPKRLRATGQQAEVLTAHKTPPLYLNPAVLKDGVYIDLKSAYFSIMCNFGWNVDYYPGRWLLMGRPPIDFPLKSHKIARNVLVSIGMSSHYTMWDGHRFQRKPSRNVHRNFGLWSLVCDVLHLIAREAVKCGAIYIHTDGYIVPSTNVDRLVEAISAFGLDYSIKGQGETFVLGFGNYRVGDRKTRKFPFPKLSKPMSYIRDLDWKIEKVIRQTVDKRWIVC